MPPTDMPRLTRRASKETVEWLLQGGFIERDEDGWYRLTEEGAYIAGRMDEGAEKAPLKARLQVIDDLTAAIAVKETELAELRGQLERVKLHQQRSQAALSGEEGTSHE
jgi:hypothetical protein